MDYNKRLLRLDIKSRIRINYTDYVVCGIIKFKSDNDKIIVRYNLYNDVNGDNKIIFVDESRRDIFFFKPHGLPKELCTGKIVLEKIAKRFYKDLSVFDAIGNLEEKDLQECNYEFRYYDENRIIGIVNDESYLVGSMLDYNEVEVLKEEENKTSVVIKKDAGVAGMAIFLFLFAFVQGYKYIVEYVILLTIIIIVEIVLRVKKK